MEVEIKNISLLKGGETGGLISVEQYGQIISHKIDAVVRVGGAYIKGTFSFNAKRFDQGTTIGDYENTIKELFKER